jgi:4-hydroxy-tetrahydrodipicolinate synthase
MAFRPEGIIIPVITPVDERGRFNERVYRRLIDYWAENGIDGVFPFGTTESFTRLTTRPTATSWM